MACLACLKLMKCFLEVNYINLKTVWTDVFTGRQEIAINCRYKLFFFCAFLRVLFLFTLLYILKVKKHTLLNKFLSQKWQPTGRKSWRLWGKKGNDFLYVVSLTQIIHWTALFIEQHERIARPCNDGADLSIKGKSLHPTVLMSYLSSYIDYKRVALKKVIIKVNCCYVAMLHRCGFSIDWVDKVSSTHIQLKWY